ncbi:hypothetical protein D8B32_27320, partial [Verminephrobacter eiseniae]|uniref:Ig-like domain-containing protein n=2 Tax=Verminephrobacter eiseniae TaxID=364317 RepID=UPI0022445A85
RLTAGETATVTFTFSERVTGFTKDDIDLTLANGTLGDLVPVGTDGKVWSATYTPNSGIESATNTIRVNLAGVLDAQGNAGTGTGSSGNFSIDTKRPEVTVAISEERLTAGEGATITITFSERVTGFTEDDIDLTLANGTLGDLEPVGTDGRVWRATFMPRPNTESANNTIRVNLAGVQDAQGNAGTGSGSSGNFSIDTKPLEVTVAISDRHLTAGETATVTVTFSERVTGFGTEDIQYDTSQGTLSALTAVGTDGKVWTATYTPRPDTESAFNRFHVNLDGVLDAQGNAGTGSVSSGNFSIDTRPTVVDRLPEVTVTISDERLSAGETATVTFTFSERVTGFDLNDVQYDTSKGTLGALTAVGTDGRVWTATYTPRPNTESADNTIRVNLAGVQDAQGNAGTGTGSSGNFSIDTRPTVVDRPPEVTVTISDERLTAGETATVTFTFSERVTGFDLNDVQYDTSKGTLSALTAVGTDGKVWTATYTPRPNTESADNTIRVNLAGVLDAQGNAGTGSASSGNFSIDTKPPEVTVTISDERLSAGETATVTFTFRESVTGFDLNDVQYDTSKGTLSALTAVGTDGKVWSATYTPSSGIESAANTIRVNLAGVLDAQGNAGTGTGSSGNFVIDTRPTVVDRPPEVTVAISDERLTAGETATVTFTFSERVTGFDLNDVQYDISKGTLSALTAVGTDGKVWTATYTPSSGIESATNTIRVNLAGV